ncbi:hypothetical protein BH11VER1_BH11VER1_03270 [soil metagenome]
MPEPVSIIGLTVGYAAMQIFARGSTAVSLESHAVCKAARDVVQYAECSQSLFGTKTAAISEVWKLADECGEADWDGNEAMVLDENAIAGAVSFIRALPEGIPMPELAPEPDGSISLDWIQSRHRLFSLSIGKSNRLAFAWLDGSDKGHGVSQFDGWKVPKRILDGIQSIVNHGDASFRAS